MMQVKKKKRRHHSLTGRITSEVMYEAFKNVKRNRGAAGVDKVSIWMYMKNLDQNLTALMRKLKTDTYQSKPLRRKLIPKGNGKFRPLGIPTLIP
jgi:RNA-directed DNA polymerase